MNLAELVLSLIEHPPAGPDDLPEAVEIEAELASQFSIYMLLSLQTGLEYGCALGLDDEETKIHAGAWREGKAHSVTINPGETPEGSAYIGTFHTHPRDEMGGFTPHSDADFVIFTNQSQCHVSLVAASGVEGLSAFPDFYLVVRTKATITGSLQTPKGNTWLDVAIIKHKKLLDAKREEIKLKSLNLSEAEWKQMDSQLLSTAAYNTTKHLAKHLKFGFYRGARSRSLVRI
jgi:hypothetical protein